MTNNETLNVITLAALAGGFNVATVGTTTLITHPDFDAGYRVEWNRDGTIQWVYRNVAGDTASLGIRRLFSDGSLVGQHMTNDELSLIVVDWITHAREDYEAVTSPDYDGGA